MATILVLHFRSLPVHCRGHQSRWSAVIGVWEGWVFAAGLWTCSVSPNHHVSWSHCCLLSYLFLQASIQRRKKPASQKKRRFKTHNDHLAGVLKDYSDITTPGK